MCKPLLIAVLNASMNLNHTMMTTTKSPLRLCWEPGGEGQAERKNDIHPLCSSLNFSIWICPSISEQLIFWVFDLFEFLNLTEQPECTFWILGRLISHLNFRTLKYVLLEREFLKQKNIWKKPFRKQSTGL